MDGQDFKDLYESYSEIYQTYEVDEEPEEVIDVYDIVISHLLDEGYADTIEVAEDFMRNMSEEWIQSIVEEAKDQSDKQIERGVKTTYKAQNMLDNRHQGRMGSKFDKFTGAQKDAKAKRMEARLKSRREALFKERQRRQDSKVAELRKILGM